MTTDKAPRGRLRMMQSEAELAETGYCSRCGRLIAHWYYGFPLPECAYCHEPSQLARFGSQVQIFTPNWARASLGRAGTLAAWQLS